MAKQALGTGVFGLDRLGDGNQNLLVAQRNALAVTYSIVPFKYNVPLTVTWTVQRAAASALLVYYLVTPTPDFAIDGDTSIIKPDKITYTPRSVSGRTLVGGPVLQGYSVMSWQYSVLSWSEWNQLISHYNPLDPVVLLTWPDEYGTWQQKNVVMLPPTYGGMTTLLVTGAVLSFTRLV